ncbi:MAG: pilus assembly protein PilV [Betaproteobacteria bacterium]
MKNTRPPLPTSGQLQRGSFLLESLIAILIVALGVLGLVGLQARAMQDVDESQFRSEAAFLASDVISRMWISDPNTMDTDFAVGGTPYNDFKAVVQQRLPGSITAPTITITQRGATATTGFDVLVTVFWQPPSSPWEHQYQMAATVRPIN